jgi:hypothetical protein
MKRTVKKLSVRKKAQDGTLLDEVNIDPVRAQQMARNRKVNEYVLKKAQLVKDQAEFSKTLPEQIGGNRLLTEAELNRKNKFKADINAYGDSIQMTRKRLTPEQLKAEYEKGRIAGLKRKDKPGSASGINYAPQSMKAAQESSREVDERGIKEGTKCKAGVKSRQCSGASRNGKTIKAKSGTKMVKKTTIVKSKPPVAKSRTTIKSKKK